MKNIFQYILAQRAKMYWKMISKSPNFVPFGVNLTYFEVEPDLRVQDIAMIGWCGKTSAYLMTSTESPALDLGLTSG